MRFVSRSAEGLLHRRYVSNLTPTRHSTQISSQREINAAVGGPDEAVLFPATSGGFHRCSSPHRHLHHIYVLKPAAGRNLPQERTPGWGQRSGPSPASHSGHRHAAIKAAASVSSPSPSSSLSASASSGGFNVLTVPLRFLRQPPRKSSPTAGQRWVSTSSVHHPSLYNPPRPSS